MADEDLVALARRLIATVPGRRDDAIAVLNGAIGDRLARAESSLAIEMSLVTGPDDRDPPTLDTPHACLLVHGLMGSHRAWAFGTRDAERVELGAELASRLGLTPLYAHYNTGLHISTNGRALADRLERMVSQTPQLEDLSIVGHSMGGLVTRSALHYGCKAGHTWVSRVRRVFLLGVPSHGARWEQLAHVAGFTLETIWNPWTKLIGKAINMRSAGIKDLRHGFVLDDDWSHRDPDTLRLAAPRRAEAPDHLRWYIAYGNLREEANALSRLFGDGLVGPGSARGEGFGSPGGVLPPAQSRMFEHTSHNALMTDPTVLEQLIEWWSDPPHNG